jgi:lipoprotein-anchoring transpeptidase ErfK/SrfK
VCFPFEVNAAQDRRRGRWRIAIVAYALLAAVLVGLAINQGWFGDDDEGGGAAPTATSTPSSTTTTVPTEVPPLTWLATPSGMVPKFDSPGGTQIGEVGVWYGYPMSMPILERQGDWLKVMTPERPNMSTGWIHASHAEIGQSNYRIVIRRAETKVIVYKDGYRLWEMPAGLGKSSTPTPLGSYFVAVKEIPGPPGYGPVVLDLSAHSEAIQSWQGAGDAIIALHGPFGAEKRIGTTGTYISNGCVRLLPADQEKLFEVPLGTPVDIV